MNRNSPAARDDTHASPSAGEFGALALFQNAAPCEHQAVAYVQSATSQADAPGSGAAETSHAVEHLTLEELQALAASRAGGSAGVAPVLQSASLAGTPAVRTTAAPSLSQTPASCALQAQEPGGHIQSASPPAARPAISRVNSAEGDAARGARRAASSRQQPTTMSLGVSLDDFGAEVAGRVQHLEVAEERELDRRIRDELAAQRLGVRAITINGRRIRSAEEE